MSTARPTFYPSRDELKKTLRMEHVKVGSPSDLVFDEAIRSVRMTFTGRLGLEKIALINTYTYVEEPQTTQQVLRFSARLAEFYFVKRACLFTMASRQLDAFGDVLRAWNYEGLIRELSAEDLAATLALLEQEGEKQLQVLDTLGVNLGNESPRNFAVIENQNTAPIPQGTVFPWLYGNRSTP